MSIISVTIHTGMSSTNDVDMEYMILFEKLRQLGYTDVRRV